MGKGERIVKDFDSERVSVELPVKDWAWLYALVFTTTGTERVDILHSINSAVVEV